MMEQIQNQVGATWRNPCFVVDHEANSSHSRNSTNQLTWEILKRHQGLKRSVRNSSGWLTTQACELGALATKGIARTVD